MTAALPPIGWGLLPYLIVAGFMIFGNLWFIRRLFPKEGGPPNYATVIIVVGLFLMSMALWMAIIGAVESPTAASVTWVFVAGNSAMGVFGVWVIGLFFRAEERRVSTKSWLWPVVFAVLLLGNEILMGTSYVLAESGNLAYSTATTNGLLELLSAGINSVWFFWAMALNMALLITWVPMSRAQRTALLGFTLSSLVGPWVVNDPVVGALGMGGVMAFVLSLIYREIRKGPVPIPYLRTAARIAGGFAVMASGRFVYVLQPNSVLNALPFALATLLVMSTELFLLARWGLRNGTVVEATVRLPLSRPADSPSPPLPES